MYISRALQNVRQRPSGQNSALAFDGFWGSPLLADASQPGIVQSGAERSCGVFFTSGGIITDDNWMAIQASMMSLTSMRTWLTANRSDVTCNSAFASTGNGRLLFQQDQRVFDFVDNTLGYFTYATQFNRMYIAISNTTSTVALSTAITSLIELTLADLQAMGANITIDSSGNGTLNAPLCLNNLILK